MTIRQPSFGGFLPCPSCSTTRRAIQDDEFVHLKASFRQYLSLPFFDSKAIRPILMVAYLFSRTSQGDSGRHCLPKPYNALEEKSITPKCRCLVVPTKHRALPIVEFAHRRSYLFLYLSLLLFDVKSNCLILEGVTYPSSHMNKDSLGHRCLPQPYIVPKLKSIPP